MSADTDFESTAFGSEYAQPGQIIEVIISKEGCAALTLNVEINMWHQPEFTQAQFDQIDAHFGIEDGMTHEAGLTYTYPNAKISPQ